MSDNMSLSLRRFEYLSLGTLAIRTVLAGLEYDTLVPAPELAELGKSGFFVVLVMGLLVMGLVSLVLLISRKKNRVAKWIYVGLAAVQLPFIVLLFAHGFEAELLVGTLSSLEVMMYYAAVYFLFQPDAREEFRK